jgi:hypothetical protein
VKRLAWEIVVACLFRDKAVSADAVKAFGQAAFAVIVMCMPCVLVGSGCTEDVQLTFPLMDVVCQVVHCSACILDDTGCSH